MLINAEDKLINFVHKTAFKIIPCTKGDAPIIPCSRATNNPFLIRAWGKYMSFIPAICVGLDNNLVIVDCLFKDFEKIIKINKDFVFQKDPFNRTQFFFQYSDLAKNIVMFKGYDIDIIKSGYVKLYLNNLKGDIMKRTIFPVVFGGIND